MQEKQIDVRVVLTQSREVAALVCKAYKVSNGEAKSTSYGATDSSFCNSAVPPMYRKAGIYYAVIEWEHTGSARKPYELILA